MVTFLAAGAGRPGVGLGLGLAEGGGGDGGGDGPVGSASVICKDLLGSLSFTGLRVRSFFFQVMQEVVSSCSSSSDSEGGSDSAGPSSSTSAASQALPLSSPFRVQPTKLQTGFLSAPEASGRLSSDSTEPPSTPTLRPEDAVTPFQSAFG